MSRQVKCPLCLELADEDTMKLRDFGERCCDECNEEIGYQQHWDDYLYEESLQYMLDEDE
jgi:hypothetical protein